MSDKKDTRNIYQRIRDVMTLVKAINKESKKVNGQYTYVSHDAVAKALHDPMANNGIVALPTVSELVQDGNRTSAKVDVTFTNVDNPEDKVTVTHFGYGVDNQDKGVGKAVSYAIKYCLLKTFCLETGDDIEKDFIDYKADTSLVDDNDVEMIKKKCAGNDALLKEITDLCNGKLEGLEKNRLQGVFKFIDAKMKGGVK